MDSTHGIPPTANTPPTEALHVGDQAYLNIMGIQHAVQITRVSHDEDGILRYGLRIIGNARQRFHGVEAEWVSTV